MSTTPATPKVGFVSWVAQKPLVDSERILTQLRMEGYEVVPTYEDADVVVVNTCGFIDSAKAESLEVIGEAIKENGKVIVTGCMGVEEGSIRDVHPSVLSVTGPQQYEQVVSAVHEVVPPRRGSQPADRLVPPQGVKLTPRHYAYLKISEGCNHSCSFCIIPSMRGKLVSRPVGEVLSEAERWSRPGSRRSGDFPGHQRLRRRRQVQDRLLERPPGQDPHARTVRSPEQLGRPGPPALRVPVPERRRRDPADGRRQDPAVPGHPVPARQPESAQGHEAPGLRRPHLARIKNWREQCPELVIRSTFIVGFPGETEEDFQYLLDWLTEAQLDRVGCFQYSPVEGAPANDTGTEEVPDDVKQERWDRFMAHQQAISAARLQLRIGKAIDVLIDEVEEQGSVGRSFFDAPEIDGSVFIDGDHGFKPGDKVRCRVVDADEYDMWAEPI